jgi:hypothetical protein
MARPRFRPPLSNRLPGQRCQPLDAGCREPSGGTWEGVSYKSPHHDDSASVLMAINTTTLVSPVGERKLRGQSNPRRAPREVLVVEGVATPHRALPPTSPWHVHPSKRGYVRVFVVPPTKASSEISGIARVGDQINIGPRRPIETILT